MFRIKQYIKMLLQNVLLPLLYAFFRHRPVRKGSVIFADAHHEEMPFAMERMYEQICALQEKGDGSCAGDRDGAKAGNCTSDRGRTKEEVCGKEVREVQVFVRDFGKLSFGAMVKFLILFMKQYATAEYVFICDYFLPVASCKKRPETKVVQLWHSCGLMKKIAFDTGEDIPKNYRGSMFENYSYLTLSADICVDVHARALRLPKERIFATGVSRTDYYFDEKWNERCREHFYEQHPEARGKKIALWAPTFRGNAAMPYLEGLEQIRSAARELSEQWFFILKAHPHIDAHGRVSNCSIPTEELLSVADVLITDYSSVLFDYLIYGKTVVLFAPDLKKYEEKRGFYLDYRRIPFQLVEDERLLKDAVTGAEEFAKVHRAEQEAFCREYVGACDGHATERILKRIGLYE